MEPMKQRCNWWKMAGILLIVFLALWHGLEVKAGAAASGNQHLLIAYGILVIAAFASLFVLQKLLKQWKLEQLYLVAGLLLGLGYLFVLPPLSAPDEISHYAASSS